MMGTYYKVACDETKENIDPGSINDLGVKKHAVAAPEHPLGPIVVFALVTRWFGKKCRAVIDVDDDLGYFDYKDITKEVIEAYNKEYHTNLEFTG
jgi:hypothetical protein